MTVPVLLLTGTVGAGKTTIAWAINDILSDLEMPNSAIDCDTLKAQWPVAYEDFVVENGDRPVRDVAVEVLTKARWV